MKPLVLLCGPITDELLDRAWSEIEYYTRSTPDIVLVINSQGGNGMKALEFIDKISSAGINISAKIYQAASAAALIALSAKNREIVANGLFVIHLGSVEVESCDIDENGQVPKNYKDAADKLKSETLMLAKRAGLPMPSHYLDKLLAHNRLTLTAEECLKLGLVERVIG